MKLKKWTSSTKKRFQLNMVRFLNEYGDCSLTKGGVDMAVLASCKCNGIAIDSAKARECIEEMNKNTVSKEFLKKCAETAKLFKRK